MATMTAVPPAPCGLMSAAHSTTNTKTASRKAKANCAPRLSSQLDHGMRTAAGPLSVSLVDPLTPSGLVVIPVREEARTAPGSTGVTSVGTGCDGDGIGSSAMKHHQFLTSVR